MLSTVLRLVLVCSAGALLTGCTEAETSTPAEIPIEVGIVTMQPAARPYIRELPGRIAPTRIAEVRARVSGIVVERTFQQGADVKAGDVLYRIDPASFEVELAGHRSGTRQGAGRARSGRAAGQARRELIAGKVATQVAARDRDRRPSARRRPTSPPARPTSRAPAQSRIRHRAFTDQRPHRPRAGHRRRAGRTGRRDASGDRSAARSRSMPTSPNRSANSTSFAATSKAATSKQSSPRPPRCGSCSTTGRSIRIPGKLLFSDATVDPDHRPGHAARRVSQSEERAAAGHVCPRADRAGHRQRCARGAAAGGPAQRRRRRARSSSCPTTTGRSCSRSGPAASSTTTG